MRCLFPVAVALLITGCTNIGPNTVPRDRFDYNMAIADSWKDQTLLNIVKLRYADMPLFVEVASVVSGYSLESSVNLGGTVSSENTVQGDFLSAGGAARYTDRPTITYAPITGSKFNQNFMKPIPPQSILFLIQSGWPADMVMPITVDSINGLRSRLDAGANQREGDTDFYRLIELFRYIQQSGSVGMRVVKDKNQKETTLLFFYKEHLSPEVEAALHEATALLRTNQEANEIMVYYGLIPGTDREIAMITLSMLQIMIKLAAQITVPSEHVEKGYTVPSLEIDEPVAGMKRLITINSGTDEPEEAFTAVKYLDHWFWIDESDFESKRTFAFLMILFSLTETGGKEGLPLVTIPAG
jgi:hypothetical protein